eukprot:3632767-Rhodomonas_salina.1
MGYDGGGLGLREQGIKEAVKVEKKEGRRGLGSGLQDKKQEKIPERDEFLFSDSSDMEDRKAFAAGMKSETMKRWDQKVRKAMGNEKIRTYKTKKSIDDEGQNEQEFVKKFDAKYGAELEAREAEFAEGGEAAEEEGEGQEEEDGEWGRRTDWAKFDQMTRERKGMRGVGEAKAAVSAKERRKERKGKKKGVFSMRSRYREEGEGEERGDAGGVKREGVGGRGKEKAEIELRHPLFKELMGAEGEEEERW